MEDCGLNRTNLKETNKNMNIIFVTGYSHYAVDAFSIRSSGYLLKPVRSEEIAAELNNLRIPIKSDNKVHIRVQTFGGFEVFVDGQPVIFSRGSCFEKAQ